MFHARSFVGALTVALLSFGTVASLGTSASAAPEPLIQGVAVDGKGRPVLDVKAVAVNADGDTVASDLSYENTDANGDPQRGYFALHVVKGTYKVVLTKDGFVKETLQGIEIKRGQWRASLGEIARLRTSKTSAKLVKVTVPVGDKGKVKVTVAPTGDKPTGPVVVKKGQKKVGSATLKATHKGELTVTLDKLPQGSHDLKVVYGGSRVHQGSTSGKLTLTVKADRNRRLVPNALAYLV